MQALKIFPKFNFKYFAITLCIVMFDIFIYLLIFTALMAYDDFYTGPTADYGSWQSRSDFDRAVVILLYCWHMINLAVVFVVAYKIYKYLNTAKN